jgi:hypothetical protein
MVSPPATFEAGVHAAGDTKSEHFEPAGVRKLSAKQFKVAVILDSSHAFPKEHLKFNPLTAVYVLPVHRLVSGLNFRCCFGKAREESKITATLSIDSLHWRSWSY